MVKNKLNLKHRKIFTYNADALRKYYAFLMMQEEQLSKAEESWIMRYLNNSASTNQFINLNQPVRLKKGKS